jgi:hypothetical protein
VRPARRRLSCRARTDCHDDLRIPMIPYTQSDVFVRGRRRPRSGRRLGPYPVSSPPSRCLIDSLQALKLAVERVEMSR